MENLEAMVDQYTHIFNLRKNAGPSTVFSVKEAVVGWQSKVEKGFFWFCQPSSVKTARVLFIKSN